MFGTTPQPASSGFHFGGGAATVPTVSSSGLSFGATSAAPATGAFSFGGGATPAAPASGFSFGATTPGPHTATVPAASSGFSFGGTPTPALNAARSGFSFGGASTASTASESGYNVGGTAGPPPAGSSGFCFNGTSATPATGFTLGGTAPPTNTFGFGGSTAAKPSIFPPTTAPSTGFSAGANATTLGTGFGGGTGTTGTGGTSAFGSLGTTGSSLFGTAGFGTTLGTTPGASTAPAPIILGADASVAQLNTVKAAYQDPTRSRFKFLMYNTVDPMQRHLYTRPPYISERLWNQAELDNPDPVHCVPVPILGFEGLLKRIKVQQEYAAKYHKYTDDLRAQLVEMDKHSRATEEKLETCRHEHVQLFHALVKVMRDIELLQHYGTPLQRPEMQLAMALKKLQTLLESPGQYKARLKDAVSMPCVPKGSQLAPPSQLRPHDLQQLYELMDKQRQGLEHLTNILTDDLADIELIKETWRR